MDQANSSCYSVFDRSYEDHEKNLRMQDVKAVLSQIFAIQDCKHKSW